MKAFYKHFRVDKNIKSTSLCVFTYLPSVVLDDSNAREDLIHKFDSLIGYFHFLRTKEAHKLKHDSIEGHQNDE